MPDTPEPAGRSTCPNNRVTRKRPVGLWIVAVFLEALFLSIAYLNVKLGYDPDYPVGPAITAGLFVTFLFPGILPMAWWAILRFDRTKASGPIISWAMLAAFIGLTGIGGAMLHAPDSETDNTTVRNDSREPEKIEYRYAYSPSGCEFSAFFPEPPTTKQRANALAYTLEEAEVFFDGTLLRAGCVVAGEDTIRDHTQLIEYIREFAAQTGLEDVVSYYSNTGGAITVRAHGAKLEAGRHVTYEYRWYVGTASTLTITARGDNTGFPQDAITGFFEAVEY